MQIVEQPHRRRGPHDAIRTLRRSWHPFPRPITPPGVGSPTRSCYNTSQPTPTDWREELLRVDHNITPKLRASFHYIHDSWTTVVTPTLWSNATLPNIETNFVGPGTSAVARLTYTASPSLLNEFVFSYTADHIALTNIGPFARPSTMTSYGHSSITASAASCPPSVSVEIMPTPSQTDPSYEPWHNANPTYTLRDNVTKIIGKHTLQFGAYGVIAQKNQENSPQIEGAIGFDASNGSVSTGNAFADLLLGNIASYSQTNNQIKYYDRYQLVEPYIQDDFHATSRLTLNIGLRMSLFGTYYEKYNREYNFNTSAWTMANEPALDQNTVALLNPNTGRAPFRFQPRRCAVPFQRHRAVRRTGPASRMPEVTLGIRRPASDSPGIPGATARLPFAVVTAYFSTTEMATRPTPRLWRAALLWCSRPASPILPGITCRQPTGYTCLGSGGGPLAFPLRSLPFRTKPFGRTRNSGI